MFELQGTLKIISFQHPINSLKQIKPSCSAPTAGVEFDMDLRLQYIAEGSRDQNFIHLGQIFNPLSKKGSSECLSSFHLCINLPRFLQQKHHLWGLLLVSAVSHTGLQCSAPFFCSFKTRAASEVGVHEIAAEASHRSLTGSWGSEKSLDYFIWVMAERNTGPFLKAETLGEKGNCSKIEKKFHAWMKDWGKTKEKFHHTKQVTL